MKNDIRITVVIETKNNFQLFHAVQIEKAKQVDLDQGSKLTRLKSLTKDFRAYLPLVVSLIGLAQVIVEKLF